MKNGILKGLLVMLAAVLVLVGCPNDLGGDIKLDLDDALSGPGYTVTFHANGGMGTPPAAVTVKKFFSFGTTMPGEGDLAKNGYIVSCWNTNASGTGTDYYIGGLYRYDDFNGNITLYAKWDNLASCQTLNAKLKWLQAYAKSDTVYTLEIIANERFVNSSPGISFDRDLQDISFGERSNITIHLKGAGGEKIIDASFSVGEGVTLILDNNITLQGVKNSMSRTSLIYVYGKLIMREGAKITGNSVSVYGGAIRVSGTFIMEGGEISGNASNSLSGSAYGGGIYLYDNGIFVMNGGKISGNNAKKESISLSLGGGVYVSEGCSFTMDGGEISNNTAENAGGGVYIEAGGIFTKSGGIITGYADDTVNGNTVKSGNNIVNLRGHAVIYASTTNPKVRDSTAGPSVNMNSSVSGTAGGWDYGI